MSLKRQRSSSPDDAKSSRLGHHIWQSNKIEDRASIFIGYYSPTMPPRELQSNAQIKSATHRMLAWRVPGSQRTLVAKSRALDIGSDDDGEKYSGKRILKVLEDMRVEGTVVVARWYGNIMLGPVRFDHMEHVARNAIRSWQQNEESESQKRRKIEVEANERANLVNDLAERDQSIKVLRSLLGEKTNTTKGEQNPSSFASTGANYSMMNLEQLRRLDKVRDGTVAFLLKRIDEVEKHPPPTSKDEMERLETKDVSKSIEDRDTTPEEGNDSKATETTPARTPDAVFEG